MDARLSNVLLAPGDHASQPSGATVATPSLYPCSEHGWERWNGATWELVDVAGVSTLAALTDVDLTTTPPADNDRLVFDSGSSLWVPAAASADAADVAYDPTASGMTATDVQAAIDELDAAVGGGGGTSDPVEDPAEYGTLLIDEEWNAGAALPTGWAWVNQGTATITRTKGRLLMVEPTAGAGNAARLIEHAIPGAATFEAILKVQGRHTPLQNFGHFICLRDSAGAKLVTFGRGHTATNTVIDLWNWTSAASFSAVAASLSTPAAIVMRFFRIKKNSATSWDFDYSEDGVVWNTLIAAHNVQTFLGTAPTHIGVGLWRNNQVTSAAFDWLRVT